MGIIGVQNREYRGVSRGNKGDSRVSNTGVWGSL